MLNDILDAAQKIAAYTSGFTYKQFCEDPKTIDAVIRNFEVIGEASKRIPDEYKSRYAHIEWRRMTGFRNRIIHDFFRD